MDTATRRKKEAEARALGKEHSARGFALALQGDWPQWKRDAYTDGWNEAREADEPREIYKKALKKIIRKKS